ncbi:MAG: prepilin-type N-terminal cleavage/methylation domain-containing protein [Betaproteobacteria bacterium]|jgi:prepilin-type N-terminal cleavage/methylation domain-containing protein|nr:prepilin-type N-terminal cleavage/methylation domain-containing protein [Betaproteobacteria bacterium]
MSGVCKSDVGSRERGFSIIELLVVIALIAIASATFLNLGDWNCSSKVRSDFDHFNSFLQSLRAKALNNQRAMQAEYHLDNGLLHVHSLVGRQQTGKQACSGTNWTWEGKDVDLIINAANFGTSKNFKICFYPDGTATAKKIFVEKQCGTDLHRYRSQIFGATGFLETAKQSLDGKTWKEL